MTKKELIKLSRENLRKSKQGSLCECYDEAFIKVYDLSKNRIAELEQENKTISRKANEAIADKLLITATYNDVLNDLNQNNYKLQKENTELKEQHKVSASNMSSSIES